MANRKATFAKRQREMDLKDHAKAKEGRRLARKTGLPRENKGPEIAWDEVFVPEDPVAGAITSPSEDPSNNDGPTPPAPAAPVTNGANVTPTNGAPAPHAPPAKKPV